MDNNNERRIIIVSNGCRTRAFVDGRVYGEDVSCIKYEHKTSEDRKRLLSPTLEITACDVPLTGSTKTCDLINLACEIDRMLKQE